MIVMLCIVTVHKELQVFNRCWSVSCDNSWPIISEVTTATLLKITFSELWRINGVPSLKKPDNLMPCTSGYDSQRCHCTTAPGGFKVLIKALLIPFSTYRLRDFGMCRNSPLSRWFICPAAAEEVNKLPSEISGDSKASPRCIVTQHLWLQTCSIIQDTKFSCTVCMTTMVEQNKIH